MNLMQTRTKTYLQALAVLIGTIVGVGTFGIPYAYSRSGFMIGFAYLAVLAVIVLFVHLMYGEISLRTNEKHRLIGYAEKYLGKKGKIMGTVTVLAIIGTLLAYTIVGGIFTKVLFSPLLPLSLTAWSIIFFSVMAFFIVTDFKTGAPVELALNVALLAIFAVLIARTVPDIAVTNLFHVGETKDLLLPYGVTLFALSGGSAVLELRDVLAGDGLMKKVIITGTLTATVLYALFALGVVGVLGTHTTPDAIQGLAGRYGTWVGIAGGLVGLLTTATSFMVMGLVLKHNFIYDLKMPPGVAITVVLGVPLILFLFATRNFVEVISFLGAVLGGIEGMLLIKMHRVAKVQGERQPEFVLNLPLPIYYFMGVVFIAGILYEIFYTIL